MVTVNIQLAQLRCQVEIQRKTLTPDGIGGTTISYTTTSTVWANIEDWRGDEGYRAERTEALVSHIITMRASTDLQISDVIVYGGRTFPVKYITTVDEGKAKYIQALCKEGDPTG